ncbi:MAG: hypothetical protein ACOYT8_04455 [Candidatus Dependentiae bacterium]
MLYRLRGLVLLFFLLFLHNTVQADYKNSLLFNSSQLLGQIPFLVSSKDCCAEQIINGGYYLYLLRYAMGSNINSIPQTHQEHLKIIIDVMWYLYATALNKNQPFDHGTLVIKDSGFALYNFLLSYVKRCNKKIRGTLKDNASWISFNPFAYPRASTHFAKSQHQFRQYGIDIRLNKNDKVCAALPSNKCHILFGIVDASLQLIFIKLEHHGIYAYDGWFGHTSGFIASRIRHALPTFEKILPTTWYAWIEQKVGHNDDPASRRERVPVAIKRQFKKILNRTNMTPIRKKYCIRTVDEYGIRALEAFAKEKMCYIADVMKHCATKQQLSIAWLPESFLVDLNNFLNALKIEYDYLPLRTGREVIVDDSELLTSLYYYLLITDKSKALVLKPFFDNLLQFRLNLRAVRKLIADGYADASRAPLSIAYEMLIRNMKYFTYQNVEIIKLISPQIADTLYKEIFSN